MDFLENVKLAPYTTLGVGGKAQWFAEAASEAEVLEAAQFARDKQVPLFVLGGGSNVLVADRGYAGLVLRMVLTGIEEVDVPKPANKRQLTVGAGEGWDGLVSYTVARSLSGIECLAGIPGTVGGTPIQNVGAYGQEVSDTITCVRVLDTATMRWEEYGAEQCRFGYRSSLFNGEEKGRFVVTNVTFLLQSSGRANIKYADLRALFRDREPSLQEAADAVRSIRRAKGMLLVEGDPDCQSAGSFFKNPVVQETEIPRIAQAAGTEITAMPRYAAGAGMVKVPAAWLVEKAGFEKGFRMGRAAISSKHALALTNLGGASAAELLALRDAIVDGVEKKFGVRLTPEPVLLG